MQNELYPVLLLAAGALGSAVVGFRIFRIGACRRRWERRDIDPKIPAWIDRRDGSPLENCEFENVSVGGAKLTLFAPSTPLPPRFLLRLSRHDTYGKECVIRWRRADSVGVEYV